MSEHYLFYCDESGEFETASSNKKSIVLALLVPEQDRERLVDDYMALKNKYLGEITNVHAKELHNHPRWADFSKELSLLTSSSTIKIASIKSGSDVLKNIPGGLDESIACNRYLYMIQALIECVLFLHPNFWCKEISFTFRHCTRVFPVKNLEAIKKLGYNVFNTNKSKSGERPNWLASVWDSAGFFVFLRRLHADYSPYSKTYGIRYFPEVEMQTASKSQDPFVHWADNIVSILVWTKDEEIRKMLSSRIEIDLEYGDEHALFKNLILKYLRGNIKEFLSEAIMQQYLLKNQYYSVQVASILSEAFNELESDEANIRLLAQLTKENVETSRGNWETTLKITDGLLRIVEKNPVIDRDSSLVKLLLLTRLSCLNHRGDTDAAAELAYRVDTKKNRTVEEFREKAELINRLAITGANRFDFIKPAQALVPYFNALNKARIELSSVEGHELSDPQLGKMASTAAQAFAFVAPFNHKYFVRSEKMFRAAIKEFRLPEDILRQEIYLAHLYLDQGDGQIIEASMKKIRLMPEADLFVRDPLKNGSGPMAFLLSLGLKYELQTGGIFFPESISWSIDELEQMFPESINEHPFQLIFSYLAKRAFDSGDMIKADALFERALTIPVCSDKASPVIITLHCQILAIWALCLIKNKENTAATGKVHRIINLMRNLEKHPKNSTIISSDSDGWFGKEIDALAKSIIKTDQLSQSLKKFLKKFTFNYR